MLQLVALVIASFLGVAAVPSGYTAAHAAHPIASDGLQGSPQLGVAGLVVQHTAPPESLTPTSGTSASAVSQRCPLDVVASGTAEQSEPAPSLLEAFEQNSARALGQRCRLLFPFHFFW